MESHEHDPFTLETENKQALTKRRLVAGAVALLGFAGIAMSYGVHERHQVEELTAQATTAKATTDQLQAQLKALTTRLNDVTMSQAANNSPHVVAANGSSASDDTADNLPPALPAPAVSNAAPIAAPSKPAAAKRTATKRRPVVDKRYTQLKAQLDDQQKQLKDTQDALAKNRADLEGSISSTRDELNGSIAKTHDELVLLEKRGERSYTEFDLAKTKQFQRIGPITLSLRKADTKHKNYDLEMIVDDNQLSKKKVNLYEPIWIHTENESQPVQIVVNRIEKNLIHGYVSAPKYKPSELATSGAASSLTPVAAHVQANGSQAQPSTNQPQQ